MKSILHTLAGAILLMLAGIGAPPAFAQSSGLDVIHTQMRLGNRICFVDHDHSYGGSGPTRRSALRAAITGWSSFTSLEYGAAWGRFSRAKNRSANCYKGGLNARKRWYCDVVAVACRRRTRADIAAARRGHVKTRHIARHVAHSRRRVVK